MQHYRPTWLVVVGIIASALVSAQLPIFGYLLSQMMFTMIKTDNPNFEKDCHFWVIMFAIMCACLFLFAYIQRLSFGLGAENLTSEVRK